MNRRRFSIVATALAALPQALHAELDDIGRVSGFDLELQRLFSTPQHAIEIGRRYLRAHPEKLDRRELNKDLVGSNGSLDFRPTSLAQLVSQWQERDFRDGAVVVLDGWILARTEVSLCALLYLNRTT